MSAQTVTDTFTLGQRSVAVVVQRLPGGKPYPRLEVTDEEPLRCCTGQHLLDDDCDRCE